MSNLTCPCGATFSSVDQATKVETRCPKCGAVVASKTPPSLEFAIQASPTISIRNRHSPSAKDVRRATDGAVASFVLGFFAFCAPFLLGIPALFLGIWALGKRKLMPRSWGSYLATTGVVLSVINMLGVGLFVPAFTKVNEARLRTITLHKFDRIGSAVLAHYDHHKGLPPAKILNDEGTPLLSWRVAILPDLGEQSLFARFHMDEPWDSPNNLPLLDQMPEIYQPDGEPCGNQTRVQMFTGRHTVNGSRQTPTLGMDLKALGGGHVTIMFVEAGTPVPWTKPEDIVTGTGDLIHLRTYSNGFLATMCDGRTCLFPPSHFNAPTLWPYIDPRQIVFMTLPD